MPVYFAVGNHDMENRGLFVSRYGPTYFSFDESGDLFVILDGELDNCSIVGKQMEFLRETIGSTQADNVFVFAHKVLWVVEGTPYYKALRYEVNVNPENPDGCNLKSNFWTEVVPLLQEAADAQIYVVAGDVGCEWAMSLFYDEYENIHFIASGMGGSEEENFLVFDVHGKDVSITAHRLDGQPLKLGTVEAYNLAHFAP
jgi:hypothetical protein